MKKFLTFTLISSSLFVGINEVKADSWDYWAFNRSSSVPTQSYKIYKIDSSQNNLSTLFSEKIFSNICAEAGCGSVEFLKQDEKTGKLLFRRTNPNEHHSFDLSTGVWTNEGESWTQNYTTYGEKPILKMQSDGSIQIGSDTNDVDITLEGLTIDGDSLITKKANGELHIGKNSWITKEENGRQKVYAKDAAGNSIPIDYTNGTKLLINGRDVEQSINNVGALSAALTGLPTVPTDTILACGLGTGTHGGDFAFSGGCASKVNEKLSINYAASMTMPGQDYAGDFEDTFSARAGFVWKLGKLLKPTQISMEEKEKMEAKILSLEENNKKIIFQNEDLKQKNQSIISQNKSLLARLERLEKIALSETQSKDLATIKLP